MSSTITNIIDKAKVPTLEGASNFVLWKQRLEMAFVLVDFQKALTDPADPNSAKAKAMIGLTVADHLIEDVISSANAKEAFEKLKSLYESHSAASVALLKQQWNELHKEPSETIALYFSRARSLKNQLVAAGQDSYR